MSKKVKKKIVLTNYQNELFLMNDLIESKDIKKDHDKKDLDKNDLDKLFNEWELLEQENINEIKNKEATQIFLTFVHCILELDKEEDQDKYKKYKQFNEVIDVNDID